MPDVNLFSIPLQEAKDTEHALGEALAQLDIWTDGSWARVSQVRTMLRHRIAQAENPKCPDPAEFVGAALRRSLMGD